MAISINNQQDILRALDTDPEFRQAVRRHLLTEDLISLPERFATFAASQQKFNSQVQEFITRQEQFNSQFQEFITRQEQFNERQEQFNQRLTDDIGILKGNVTARAAWDRHQEIAQQLGFTIIRVLSRADLTNLANRSDTSGLSLDELRSFYRADLIMEVADDGNDTHFLAMEASYTADQRDTERVARNVQFLTHFTGQPAHPVIASLMNDRAVQHLVDGNAVHWFQLTERDLQPD